MHAARAASIVLSCVLFASVAASCSGSESPTENGRAPLTIVSGEGQSDTVTALLPQPVVVEVRNKSGAISPGSVVQFKSVPISSPSNPPFVYVSATATQNDQFSASSQADGQGRAKAFIKMGRIAGTAGLEVSVPALGVADTIVFTVLHGAPAQLSLAPVDTTVLTGGTYAMRSTASDAYGNPVAGVAPTYASTGVTVTAAGQVTGGSTFARARIVATLGTATASANMRVLERLPIVANDAGKLASLNTDLTSETVFDSTGDYSGSPHSVKGSTSIVYYRGDPAVDSKVWVVTAGTAPRQLLPGAVGFEAWARLSPDGNWVYFVRNNKSLWRAHLDGSLLDSLGTVSTVEFYRAPTISPDGATVAVQEGSGVKFIDVATKATTTMSATCRHPRYSPDGTSFVCWNTSGVVVMNIDGTNARTVAPSFFDPMANYAGPDWTADGKWIITGSAGQIFNVATGAAIPLSLPAQTSFVR
jgi:hypothetical protein